MKTMILMFKYKYGGKCRICGKESSVVSSYLGVCASCIRERSGDALPIALRRHLLYRSNIGLPEIPPKSKDGLKCKFCGNSCVLKESEKGYCGIILNRHGKLSPITNDWSKAVGLYYLDPHPTNCVAGPVCPANTSRGYPKYTMTENVEYGYSNLAVFYGGCNFNCLFCQNYEHKSMSVKGKPVMAIDELLKEAMKPNVSCICFFGGDPGPFIIHALAVSRKVLKKAKEIGVIKRICWETNGYENPSLMREMAKISLKSGGIVKIDFKAWTPSIYKALTGVDAVHRVKENVKLVAKMFNERPEPPLLVVSILLVPGYVDVYEVRKIGEYIFSINSKIPVVLLAFSPQHLLSDLPPTSRKHAFEAYKVLKEEIGLKEVYIGNIWLLGDYY